MNNTKKLVSDKTINAYINRLKNMQKYENSEKGDELFIEKYIVQSEQVENLYVKAKINDFEIFNDEPKEYGSNKAPRPMETLLASIANCLEISALLYFTFAKLDIKSIKVQVEATIDKRSVLTDKNRPMPGFYSFNITWYIETEENLKKIERVIERVENNCHALGTISRSHTFPKKIIILKNNNNSK